MRTLFVEWGLSYHSYRIDPDMQPPVDWDHVQQAALDAANDNNEFGSMAPHGPEILSWYCV